MTDCQKNKPGGKPWQGAREIRKLRWGVGEYSKQAAAKDC
jgi:hypothetical protein